MSTTAAEQRQALQALHGGSAEQVQEALRLPLGRPTERQLRLRLWQHRGVLTHHYTYNPGDGTRYVFTLTGGGERSLSGRTLDTFLDGLAAGWWGRGNVTG